MLCSGTTILKELFPIFIGKYKGNNPNSLNKTLMLSY